METRHARAMEMSALAMSGGSGSKSAFSESSTGMKTWVFERVTAGRGRAMGGEAGVAAGWEVEGGVFGSIVRGEGLSLVSLDCVEDMS